MAIAAWGTTVRAAGALVLAFGLSGSAIGQVTWQHQDVFTCPSALGNDGSCWPSYGYCWQGTGIGYPPVFNEGYPLWLGFDAQDRPILTGEMPLANQPVSFVATPVGPNSWSVLNSGLGVPVLPPIVGRVGVAGMALDITGTGYAVTCTTSPVSGFKSFLWHTSPASILLMDASLFDGKRPDTAVVRPNRNSPGAHWAGATRIDFSGSTCEQAQLYFDGARIDLANFNSNNWGQAVSYDMDLGPDGQGNVVAEFIDTNCDPAINPSGLYFWRTSAPTWHQIAPADIGERGVKIAVDGSGVIHVFGAKYAQSTGIGGPILHWTSADNGATWSPVPEQVIPFLTFRDLYAVAASNAGTIGVAYWTSPTMQELRFVEKRCGTWTEYTNLGTAGTGASSIKVAYDSQDRPYIAYFEKPAQPTPGTFKLVTATTALTAALTDPTPITVCPSAPVSATVQSTGGGSPTYQWQARFKGTGWFDLAEGSNPWDNGAGAAFNAAGAQTATVTITGMADAPEDFPFSSTIALRCVASSACGSATSDMLVATICPADYNCDSFVSGDDFDAFVGDFELGLPRADINADTFVSGDDFDVFVERFEAGC